MFNKYLLTQCREPQFKEQYIDAALPPDIINEEEEYKVEEVWNHRKQGCNTQLLVYWKKYGNEHDYWISKTGLSHANKAIKDYWTRISD